MAAQTASSTLYHAPNALHASSGLDPRNHGRADVRKATLVSRQFIRNDARYPFDISTIAFDSTATQYTLTAQLEKMSGSFQGFRVTGRLLSTAANGSLGHQVGAPGVIVPGVKMQRMMMYQLFDRIEISVAGKLVMNMQFRDCRYFRDKTWNRSTWDNIGPMCGDMTDAQRQLQYQNNADPVVGSSRTMSMFIPFVGGAVTNERLALLFAGEGEIRIVLRASANRPVFDTEGWVLGTQAQMVSTFEVVDLAIEVSKRLTPSTDQIAVTYDRKVRKWAQPEIFSKQYNLVQNVDGSVDVPVTDEFTVLGRSLDCKLYPTALVADGVLDDQRKALQIDRHQYVVDVPDPVVDEQTNNWIKRRPYQFMAPDDPRRFTALPTLPELQHPGVIIELCELPHVVPKVSMFGNAYPPIRIGKTPVHYIRLWPKGGVFPGGITATLTLYNLRFTNIATFANGITRLNASNTAWDAPHGLNNV
jgi:hypothetical protein